MLLPGTEIHLFIFFILLIEFVFFLFQILYFLARPNDKQRRWFLLLLFFVVYYNTVSGFLPDKNITYISIELQNVIAYSGGLFLSFYLPFYIFKSFRLKTLKFYAYWGSPLFLLMPFMMCFILPYYVTGDLNLSRKLVVIVPFVYALSFIYSLSKALYSDYAYLIKIFSKIEVLGIYITVILWTALPIIVYFDGSQLIENTVVNIGFLLLIIIAIRKNIKLSRQEYEMLTASKAVSLIPKVNIGLNENQFQKNCIDFNLTAREIQMVHYLAKGYTYKEIAEELFISDKTVARHISNIYAKTDVSQRADLLEKLEYSLQIA